MHARYCYHPGMVIDAVRRRRRRRLAWCVGALALLFGLPLLLGVVADAQTTTTASGHLTVNALDWTNVRDSAGVPLSQYSFVTAEASMVRPFQTILTILVRLEFLGWWVLITLSIWVIGWVIAFSWLNGLSRALDGVGHSLAGQLGTSTMAVTAITFGAFFVAYFVTRGQYGKALRQVVMMLLVAIMGTIFLAEPLGHVLGPHGVLAKGRDVGVSVAAGLNGNSAPHPDQVVAAMQRSLADNLARRPLQVWNFGHVIDDRGSCGATWSAGMSARDNDLVRQGLYSCRDLDAYTAASDPSTGDVLQRPATGLIMLVCGLIMMLFAVGIALRIMTTAFDSVRFALLAIFGFAAGGYVYGPSQTFLIRNLVDSVFAGLSMAAYTIFLGVYVLFLGDLFRQTGGGEVFAVLVIASLVELIAFAQVRRLRRSIDQGAQWVSSRFAATLQRDAAVKRATGSPSGAALALGAGPGAGSGPGSSSYSLTGLHVLAMLNAVNTLNVNPAMEWLFRGGTSAFSPRARGRRLVDRRNIQIARQGWQIATYRRAQHYRDFVDFFRDHTAERFMAGQDFGRRNHAVSTMFRVAVPTYSQIPWSDIAGSLKDVGVDDQSIRHALDAYSRMREHIHQVTTTGFRPRVFYASALKAYLAGRANGTGTDYNLALVFVRGMSLFQNTPKPLRPTLRNEFRNSIDAALKNPQLSPYEKGGKSLSDLVPDELWQKASADDLRYAATKVVEQTRDAARNMVKNDSNANIRSVERWDNIARDFDAITDYLPGNPWPGPSAHNRPSWAKASSASYEE